MKAKMERSTYVETRHPDVLQAAIKQKIALNKVFARKVQIRMAIKTSNGSFKTVRGFEYSYPIVKPVNGKILTMVNGRIRYSVKRIHSAKSYSTKLGHKQVKTWLSKVLTPAKIAAYKLLF